MDDSEHKTNETVLKENSLETVTYSNRDFDAGNATTVTPEVCTMDDSAQEIPTAIVGESELEDYNKAIIKKLPVTVNEESKSLQDHYVNENIMRLVPSGNPDVSEIDENDEELLCGDAIGSTTYSSRFLLNALFDLTKEIPDDITDSEVENNLSIVWDMTMECEVIDYMLQFEALEIFFITLEKTNDKRLTELLVGIIANMCDNEKTIKTMYSKHLDLIQLLLELCGCTDMRTLEQLMRLWMVIISKCVTNAEVFQWCNLVCQSNDFINGIVSILTNGYKKTVLLQTMKTLYAFLIRYSTALEKHTANKSFDADTTNADASENDYATLLAVFKDRFIRSDVVKATTEALHTLLTDTTDDNFEAYNLERKAKILFCYSHSILTKYSPNSQTAYESNYEEVSKCMQLILKSLYNSSRTFKVWDEYEMDILQTVTDFVTIAPFDMKIMQLCVKIWYNITTNIENEKAKPKNTNLTSSGKLLEDKNTYDDIEIELSKNLFSLLMYCIRKAEKEDLKRCFDCVRKEITAKLIKNFMNMEATPTVRACIDKLTV